MPVQIISGICQQGNGIQHAQRTERDSGIHQFQILIYPFQTLLVSRIAILTQLDNIPVIQGEQVAGYHIPLYYLGIFIKIGSHEVKHRIFL